MSLSTTTRPVVGETITDLESEIKHQYLIDLERLQQLPRAIEQAQESLEQSEGALAGLEYDWGRGERLDGLEAYGLAMAACRRDGLHLEGLGDESRRIAQSIGNIDKQAAEVVADLVRFALGDAVLVVATYANPATVASRLGEEHGAVCIVGQTRQGDSAGGLIRGPVTIVYLRPASHLKPLDLEDILRAARGTQMQLESGGSTRHTENRDTLSLSLSRGYRALPVLGKGPTEDDLQRVGGWLVGRVAGAVTVAGKSAGLQAIQAEPGALRGTHLAARCDGVSLEDDEVVGTERRLTIEARLALHTIKAAPGEGGTRGAIRREIDSLRGQMVKGFGIVRDLEMAAASDAYEPREIIDAEDGPRDANSMGPVGNALQGCIVTMTFGSAPTA